MESIDTGVPQGSILGPLLFIVYINDFVYCSGLQKILFADDTSLFFSYKQNDHLENLLNNQLVEINTWFRCNHLSLNINKSYYIVFCSNRNKNSEHNMNIHIDGAPIKRVDSTKFLGVHIDQYLNFAKHINELGKKLSKIVGLLFKVRNFLPLQALLTLYRSLFEPHLNYCNVIWNNTYPTYTTKLLTLQKKALRAISWAAYNSPSDPLFHRYKLLKLPEINVLQNACVMYKVTYGLNIRLTELIPLFLPPHQHDTRNKFLSKGKNRTLEITRLGICYRGPRIWNELESDLKNSASLTIFKRKLKQRLLDSYNG